VNYRQAIFSIPSSRFSENDAPHGNFIPKIIPSGYEAFRILPIPTMMRPEMMLPDLRFPTLMRHLPAAFDF